jgi:hypothetical protein
MLSYDHCIIITKRQDMEIVHISKDIGRDKVNYTHMACTHTQDGISLGLNKKGDHVIWENMLKHGGNYAR